MAIFKSAADVMRRFQPEEGVLMCGTVERAQTAAAAAADVADGHGTAAEGGTRAVDRLSDTGIWSPNVSRVVAQALEAHGQVQKLLCVARSHFLRPVSARFSPHR